MKPTNPGLSFGPAAHLYDTIRPAYPPDAVAWALAPLGPGRSRIADIGAGTGIMTRLLGAAGHHVIAVEPDALMRARLVAATTAARPNAATSDTASSVTVVDGSAQALPFAHAALDGAVAAQAYHWFDRSRAHAELARVIRPGGVIAAVWNRRDDSVPWVAEYSRIVDEAKADAAGRDRYAYTVETFGPAYGTIEQARFRHRSRHTPESLVRLMQSRSYYLRANATLQRDLVRAVVDLTLRHPDLAGHAEFGLSHETLVFRAVRVGGGED
jgi:SAM-dependent methyltransferase